MSAKKPNFFIIGAPKCGTTSLDAWLKSHPRIFTAVKEPNYFNTRGFG
ncbi:MAG: sulfotransferase, partial [Gammaproteobacteria bacterium]|nr:sulfotransferase [Gammaproteobacteria bacterium]